MLQTLLLAALTIVPAPAPKASPDVAATPPGHFFENPLPLRVSVSAVYGDVDGDGRVDIVQSESASLEEFAGPYGAYRLTVQRGMPGGHFALPDVLYQCKTCHFVPSLFQFDGDAALEVAFVHRGLRVADIGEFPAAGWLESFDVPDPYSEYLIVQDLDHDGFDELMVHEIDAYASQNPLRASVWSPDGMGGFEHRYGPWFTLPDYADPYQLRRTTDLAPDLDHDGLVDLVESPCRDALCFFRNDPHGELRFQPAPAGAVGVVSLASDYADLDQDGYPDRVWTDVGLWDGIRIDLQTAPLTFETVAEFPRLWFETDPTIGFPRIADVDGNGLADIVHTQENQLVALMHVEPGTFETRITPYATFKAGSFDLVDLDADGCLDVVTQHGLWFRGIACGPAEDLAVEIAGDGARLDVTLRHAEGTETFDQVWVRVMVATTAADAAGVRTKAVQVVAPAGCEPLPARAPRLLFNCVRPTLAPGEQVTWRFALKTHLQTRAWQPILGVAFLSGGRANARPENDRDEIRVVATGRSTQAPPGTAPPSPRDPDAGQPSPRPRDRMSGAMR